MKSPLFRLSGVVILALLIDFLFWKEGFGLNAFLLSFAWVGALLLFHAHARQSRSFWLSAVATLLVGGMVVWRHSGAAQLTFFVSAMCTAGFAQDSRIRFPLNALFLYLASLFTMPAQLYKLTGDAEKSKDNSARKVSRAIGLGCLPLLVALVFYGIYYAANAHFAAMAEAFWGRVWRLLYIDISLSHFIFFVMALFIAGGALLSAKSRYGEDEAQIPDTLIHTRPPRKRYLESRSILGLKREFLQQNILLYMLNGLLFIVNLTDIAYVWFNYDDAQINLKSALHEGTYLLIGSILLAMSVLFYAFRKNLNFYPKADRLKLISGFWLAQNAVLAISVGIRTWYYIHHHGLAYKRIGVLLFLLLVFVGLAVLWLKIKDRHSMYWLWRKGAWTFYLLMVVNACFDWDTLITRYNLSGKPVSTIDLKHMIYDMSDKNLFLLEHQQSRLSSITMYPEIGKEEIAQGIAAKRRDYLDRIGRHTWKSWNLPDERNKIYDARF